MRNPEPEATFDYVVVGGGSAGCAVAARLSEDPAVSVCLLEAGPDDRDLDVVLRLDRWMELLGSGLDWDYPVTEQERGNSWMRHSRAKVLGGCSSHNSCIAFHPPREDLDEWAAMGCDGWSAAEVAPLLRRLETADADDPNPERGTDGPVRITQIPALDPTGVALLEAAAEVGLPTVRFNQGRTVSNGAGFFQINREDDGRRSSASVAYLHPIMDGRPNLEVRTGAWARRVLFEGSGGEAARPGEGEPRAVGVEYATGELDTPHVVAARREVLLSAGAIDSPKLLMLSGVGPAAHLREHGLDVLADNPAVGENLDDHVEGLVMWEAAKPMTTESTQWWEIGVFDTIDRDPAREGGVPDRPDLMMHYGSVPFDIQTVRRGYPTTQNGFCLTPNVTRGRSRGTVRLSSRDVRDRPYVDPRYFTDPEGYDLRIMVAGLRRAREIAARAPLHPWIARELAPGPDATTDDELAHYVRQTHNTVYHPACTARMGAAEDPAAALDPRLRVKGVRGLRVVDGSALPFLPAINPNITTMVIGEKAADMLRADAARG